MNSKDFEKILFQCGIYCNSLEYPVNKTIVINKVFPSIEKMYNIKIPSNWEKSVSNYRELYEMTTRLTAERQSLEIVRYTDMTKVNDCLKGIESINNSLWENNRSLKRNLNVVQDAPIDIKRSLGFIIDKQSIEKSIENVYKQNIDYTKEIGRAVHSTNVIIGNILELIKLLAYLDKVIYEKLDDESIANCKTTEILRDFLKENNITNENVAELLDSSMQRTFTLRDRINEIKHHLQDLEQQVNSQHEDIANEKDKAISEIYAKEKEIEEVCSKSIDNLNSRFVKNQKSIQDYSDELFRTKDEAIEQILKLRQQIKDEVDSNIKEVNKLREFIETETEKSIEKVTNVVDSCICKIQRLHESIINDNEKFKAEIESIQERHKQELNDVQNTFFTKMKKKFTYVMIVEVSMAAIISIAISLFIK